MSSPRRFLMSPPAYYVSALERNRWGAKPVRVDRDLAEKQWEAVYEWLGAQQDVSVELFDPMKGLPDLVFAGHAGFVRQGIFVKSRSRYFKRRQDEIEIERWFRKKNYDVKTVPEPYCFEGQADALKFENWILAGCFFRADAEAIDLVEKMLNKECISLQLQEGALGHLGTCLRPLNQTTALVFREAFEVYSLKTIQELFDDVVWVPEHEAMKFVCDSLCVGTQAALPRECPQTKAELESRGFTVAEFDLSEFSKAGSGTGSLALDIGP